MDGERRVQLTCRRFAPLLLFAVLLILVVLQSGCAGSAAPADMPVAMPALTDVMPATQVEVGGSDGVSLPDLVVEIKGPDESAFPGQTLGGITVDVANKGYSSARSFEVGLYLSPDQAIDQSDLPLQGGRAYIEALQPGEVTQVQMNDLWLPTDMCADGYYLGVIVDETRMVEETDEINNTGSWFMRINGAVSAMQQRVAEGAWIKQIAFAPDAGWTILYNTSDYWWCGIPSGAADKLNELYNAGAELKQIAFPPGGGWVILYNWNEAWWDTIPSGAADKLYELYNAGAELKQIAFPPGGGWVILGNNNGYWYDAIPSGAADKLNELYNAGAELKQIAFSPGGGWVILYNWNEAWWDTIPSGAADKLKELYNAGAELKQIVFSPGGGWVILGNNEWWEGVQ